MIAPVKCGVISVYMASVTGLISDTCKVLDEVILVSASRKRKKH